MRLPFVLVVLWSLGPSGLGCTGGLAPDAASEKKAKQSAAAPATPAPTRKLRDGDIIFQRSQSRQSVAIALATHSQYTHVGVVVHRGGKALVFEAVSPVKLTPLAKWKGRGRGGHYVIKRLATHPDGLAATEVAKMKKLAQSWKGCSYDWRFGWDDSELYCSELVWKLYARALDIEISEPRRLGDFDLGSEPVRKKLESRYKGKALPLDAPVVAPSDLFDSELLVTVPDV